jgi:hypothetical protein
VGTGEARGLDAPADGAPDAPHAVGGHGLAVPGAAEDQAALAIASGHGVCGGPTNAG